jgi:hypothetical protein
LFILVKGVLGGWLTMCPVLFLSISCLMTLNVYVQEVPTFLLEPSYMERNENEGYYIKVIFVFFKMNFVFKN